jgi:hypothetical protein
LAAFVLLDALIGVVILAVRWHKATAVLPMPMPPPVAMPRTPQVGPPELQSPVATS